MIATQKETDLSHEASADTPTGKAALTGVHESADRGPVQRRSAKTFIFHNSIRDLSEFRGYAEIASRLTPYGTVELDIGVLAEKSPTHMPGFRSPWHDYGAYMATMWAFFPHPALAPHLSSDWVAKNRALLLGKVAILEEMGLEAVFSANESQFLPESFFREYPHLRGPRVDAQARSNSPAFAWCVDQPATLEMIEWMMAELKRHAPHIQEIHSWNNDSGSGLCWLHSLYPGPNGPAHCRTIDPGARVRGVVEAMDRGACEGGGPVHIRMAGNFDERDREKIGPLLPSSAKFGETFTRDGDHSLAVVATRVTEAYPIRGIIDLFAVLEALNNVADPSVRTVDIDTCQSWYYRTDEPLATVRRLVDIVEDAMKHPDPGHEGPTAKARALAVAWAGEKNAESVVQAFELVGQSFSPFLKRDIGFRDDVILGRGYAFTATNRLLTRPLLLKPEVLTPEEEAYFLPFIFSADDDDARLDYNTAHSDRRFGPTEYRSPAFRNVHDSALEAAAIFEQAADSSDGEWFQQIALSLRLWASAVRSHDNFAQRSATEMRRVLPPLHGGCSRIWPQRPISCCGTKSSAMSWTMPTTSERCWNTGVWNSWHTPSTPGPRTASCMVRTCSKRSRRR